MLHDLCGASALEVMGSFLKKLRFCRMSCLGRVLPEARFLTEGLDTIRDTESSRSPSGMFLLVRVSRAPTKLASTFDSFPLSFSTQRDKTNTPVPKDSTLTEKMTARYKKVNIPHRQNIVAELWPAIVSGSHMSSEL